MRDRDLFGAIVAPPASSILATRFGVPPFSVLNAREGDWQERKRRWLALGIRSELGRGANALGLSGEAEAYRRGDYARTFGQDLMPGEHDLGAQGNQDENQSGTSIFDPVVCELAYRWFCPPAGAVLDPFAGGSVRGITAAVLGLHYTGVDLRPEQCAANAEQAAQITPDRLPRWVTGDSRDIAEIAAGAYDFVFSCPPYGNLERYSDDPRDLSAVPHADFVAGYRAIIKAACRLLRKDRFACFCVGDFRDKRGIYRDFVSETIAAFRDAGAALYNEAILIAMVGSLPVRVGRQFESARKLGKTHQNILVFVKGDPRSAAAACAGGMAEQKDAAA